MLSAPVSRQTRRRMDHGEIQTKIRKNLLQQLDLLHLRVSVALKDWHLQHCYAEAFPQYWFREEWQLLYTFFCCTICSAFRHSNGFLIQFCLAWKISFFHSNIPKYFMWTGSHDKPGVPLISLSALNFTGSLHLYRSLLTCTGLFFFYLYIINTRVINNIFSMWHAISCLSS